MLHDKFSTSLLLTFVLLLQISHGKLKSSFSRSVLRASKAFCRSTAMEKVLIPLKWLHYSVLGFSGGDYQRKASGLCDFFFIFLSNM